MNELLELALNKNFWRNLTKDVLWLTFGVMTEFLAALFDFKYSLVVFSEYYPFGILSFLIVPTLITYLYIEWDIKDKEFETYSTIK
jgi:intracellular septation protein A